LLIRQRRSIGTRHDISDGNTLAKLRLMQVVEISGRNNARVMRAGVVLTACGLLPVFRSALRETEFASSRTFRLRTGPQRLPGLLGMRVPVSIFCIEVKFFPGRTKLAMQGKNPDEIVEGLRAAYTKGELPRRDVVSFAYMWSVDQDLASGVGHWHPHVMAFAPYYDNSMVGGNTFGSPLPTLSDAGTRFAVVVIPVDDKLAIKAELK